MPTKQKRRRQSTPAEKKIVKFKTIDLAPYCTKVFISLGQSLPTLAKVLAPQLNSDAEELMMFLYDEDYPLDGDQLEETYGQGKKSDCDRSHQLTAKAETISFPNGYVLIWLHTFPDSARELSYVAHEVDHAVYFIMDRIDTARTADTLEVSAYLTNYLIEEIFNMLTIKVSPTYE